MATSATPGGCRKAAYVLHCFQKKTQRTAKADLDIGKARYQAMRTLIKETKKR